VAYSSISHMGLIMLAVFSLNFEALEGALYQMLNQGLSTGALFLCVGLLYERSHTRQIKEFGGVGRQMPIFSALLLIVILSSMGLPGLNGFVGEVLCFFGIFTSNKVLAVPAVATAVLSAAYLLLLFQKVMHGPIVHEPVRAFKDVGKRELAVLVPVIVLMFWMGLFPGPFLRKMDASVARALALAKGKERVSLLPGAASARCPGVLGANGGKRETR
ncbi:MAG: Fe-S-binding domain-containing protein, partial [Candidatus Aminicenantes bacterium]|nr:Fe-S-binding domain-containing protein [Candidatus Aminicenantes bacterium]